MRYTISEMAALLGVTTHTLRYYEKMGLIQPEVNRETGYRYYTVTDTRRFNLCRELRAAGFTLEEEARNDPALQAEKAEWLECMPAVHWVSRLPSRVMEQFRVGRNEYDYGLLVEADAARQLGLRRTDHVELVCGGDYLTTVWKKDYRGSFGWDSLEVLHAEILRRGFRAVGDTFSSILASREQPDGSIINYHLTRTKIYT